MSPGKTPRGNHGSPVDATTPVAAGRRGQRPGGRSARVRAAVLQSAFAVLTEKGASTPSSASRHSDAVAARRSYFRQRFDLARVIFDRAVSRGEFPRHADPMLFLVTLIAPLYLRLLVTAEPLEDWPTNEMIDRLLAGYGAQRE
jgi:Tetracyclin repressor-like, C-terminal domain